MKKGNILLFLMLLAGLSLLLYPTFSDYWNSLHQTRAVANYIEEVNRLDNDRYDEILQSAEAYNRRLLDRVNEYSLPEELQEEYMQQLNISGNGIMAYVEIPSIDVYLPIYHGTDESVLQIAIGHLDWTSLPTGGIGTHCVVSGHRGLPSARLLTDLDQMEAGDRFIIHVMDQILTYEVDQIEIVEPYDTEELLIDPEQDYCTLVTCTPYGVNSHRMLVRGVRTDNAAESKFVRIMADATLIDPIIVAPVLAAPILLILLVLLLIPKPRKKRRNGS